MITKKNAHQGFFLVSLFFIALGIRIIYLLEFYQNNPLFDIVLQAFDHSNFDQGAINFSKGDLLAQGANNSFAPLYKYFLGIIYFLFGRNFFVIYIIQFVMGSLAAVLIYLIAKEHFGFRAGVIAFLGFAFYSPQIIYEGIILRAAFISFFGILSFYFLSRLNSSFSIGNLISSALALSLFIQGRPNVILCLPFVFLFLHKNFYSMETGEKIKYWLTFTGILFLSFIPLLIQCYMVHDKFVFFDASGPHTFIAGNLITYSGVGFDKAIVEDYRSKNILGYLSNINFLFNHILENPIEFIKLYMRKTYYFLNDHEAPTNISIYLYRELSNTLSIILGHFALFSSLGLIGILLAVKNKKQIFLLYSYIFSLSVAVIIFLNESRYRIPVVPYFIIFSSYTVDIIITWISKKKYTRAFVTILAAIMLFIAFLEPKGLRRIRTIDYSNMAVSWIEKGNMKKAINYFDQAISTNIYDPIGYFNKGQLYLATKDWFNAELNFKKAFFLSRKNTVFRQKMIDAIITTGARYLEKKDYKNAVEIYSITQKIDPQNVNVLLNMGVCHVYLGNIEKAKKIFGSILKIDPDNSVAKTNFNLL